MYYDLYFFQLFFLQQRFEDLSKLIELDVSAFDMFDLPPVKEYELYIRSFGRSDTQQAYVQTRDDDVDRDIQTEEIEVLSKWTQHPPDEDTAVGGNSRWNDCMGLAHPHKVDLSHRTNKFLEPETIWNEV